MPRIANIKKFERPKVTSESRSGGSHVLLELQSATVSVQNNEPLSKTLESLYNDIADLTSQPQIAKSLHEGLDRLIDVHTRDQLDQFKQNDYEQMHFLRKLNQCWRNNCIHLQQIRGIYLYLDRKHVLPETSIMSIWDLGIDKFRHYFSENTHLKKRAVDEILNLIEQERRGIVIDRALVKDLLSMLSSLSLYKKLFEQQFLTETRRVYQVDSERLFNEGDVPRYLAYINRILAEESERSAYYLDSLTHIPLIQCIEKELIANHTTSILAKGLDSLLDHSRLEDLKLLHNLLGRVPEGLQELCASLNKYIKAHGQVIVSSIDRDKYMVQDLLDYKEKMDMIVNECFQKQEKFVYSLKEAFESFINQRPNKPAELVAKYIDSKLKSGNKQATEDELEKILDQILVLFRFIHGKDVFEAFYKKDLAKRLLVNKSASVDAEKSMLSKLKAECGAAFTSKLEGMFKDIELSKDLMTTFRNHLASQKMDTLIDLHVNVLTMGYWPTYQPIEINLPETLLNQQKAFHAFYTGKHTGRKLQWQPNLGHCALIASFTVSGQTRRHELCVSLFQALVFLMFNDKDDISYKEMAEETKIGPVELKRTLQSIACGKYRVLLKEPKGREISEEDRFTFNEHFKCQLYKIKINQVQLKETKEEQSKTEERVFQDRQYQIDAAIVRIMKTRKKISHTNLLQEVFDQVKFSVRAQDIKMRIESLIDREYLNRCETNPNEYNYVA